MNALEIHLNKIAPGLYAKFEESKNEVTLLLQKYSSNFPEYTDHSINHTLDVFKIASELLTPEEIESLGADETYILSMACILHDVGMCIPEKKVKEVLGSDVLVSYMKSHPNLTLEESIRDIHHSLSRKFINEETELLKIPTPKYANAIGIVAEGHRKVDLGNFDVYDPQYFAKSGRESVCLSYLACILRIADELDVTNSRVPKLLTKYYMPSNEISVREWSKHVATSQRNYRDNVVVFEVDCSDQNIYAALQDQFDKIQNVINYCQKVIRAIPFIKDKHFQLNLSLVSVKYNFVGFHPKGIKFSFDVQNVVTAFIGEDLYKDSMTSLREAIQNSIDSCRYKIKVLKESYTPNIRINVQNEFIRVEDNGAGMDEFIIENFFGRLGSSFYEQEKIRTQFEAIGQFGVGVFSYFLMSEYIDIETKTTNSKALKFRFDKDPKSYFHFYDTAERDIPGTTITMYLKPDLIGKLVDNEIEDYIRKTFKHIEIPIELIIKDNIMRLEYNGFDIDTTKEIKDKLKLQNRILVDKLDIIKVSISDEEVEGMCGLIIGKKNIKTFYYDVSSFEYDQFESINHRLHSQISFTQKGVFVNNYSSPSLNLMIGDINLKKKVRINIDRNGFRDGDQINKIINQFEVEILKKIFSSLEEQCLEENDRIQITRDFLNNYFRIHTFRTDDYIDLSKSYAELLKDFLCVRVFLGDKSVVINLKELLSNYSQFILISEKENESDVFGYFQIPVIKTDGYDYEGSFRTLSEMISILFEWQKSILFYYDKAYLQFHVSIDEYPNYKKNIQKVNEIIEDRYQDFAMSKSKSLFLNIWRNKDQYDFRVDNESSFINYDHHFIQFVLSNYDNLEENSEYFKIVNSAFNYMNELQDSNEIGDVELRRLNEILKPLNLLGKMKKIQLKDFATFS